MRAIRIGDAIVFAPDVESLQSLVDHTVARGTPWRPIDAHDMRVTVAVLERRGVPK